MPHLGGHVDDHRQVNGKDKLPPQKAGLDSKTAKKAPQKPQASQKQPAKAPSSEQPAPGVGVSTKVVYTTLHPTFSGKIAGYLTQDGSSHYLPAETGRATYVETRTTDQHISVAPSSGRGVAGYPLQGTNSLVLASSTIAYGTNPTDAYSTESPSSSSSSSSGLSTGAKAGIAIGVVAAFALIVGLIIFAYRRHKDNEERERLDDEKTAMASTVAPLAPRVNIRNNDTEPPRLSMRPLTDLFPSTNTPQNATSNGFLAPTAAAAAAAAAGGSRSASPAGQPGQDSYEMRTRENLHNDPSNPFGNHAETVNGGPQRSLVAGADPISPKPSVRSGNSGRSSPDPSKLPPSRSASPAIGGAGFAGADRPGSAARGPPPGPNNVHRVQLDFKPSMEDELELRAGQVVRMLHEYDDGWALCIRLDRSQQGVVPRTCISKHPVRPRPPPGARGPPQGPPRAMSPANGMRSGRASPAFDMQGRPMGPPPPGGRVRSYSNSSGRPGRPPGSMSPNPGSYYNGRPDSRRRSNSVGGPYQGPYPGRRQSPPEGGPYPARRQSPPEGGPMNPSAFNYQSGGPPPRKPVAGQAI